MCFSLLFSLLPLTASAQGPVPEEIFASMLTLSLNEIAPLQEEDLHAAAALVRPSAVGVRTEKARGSGCIVEIDAEVIRVATAAHVVEESRGGRILFPAGGTAVCSAAFQTEHRDEERDIAILAVAAVDVPAQVRLRLRAVSAGQSVEAPDSRGSSGGAGREKSPAGSRIFCFREGEVHAGVVIPAAALPVADGRDSAAETPLWCLMDAAPGMSGAGVFDARGNYLGMVAGGNDEITYVIADTEIIFGYTGKQADSLPR